MVEQNKEKVLREQMYLLYITMITICLLR